MSPFEAADYLDAAAKQSEEQIEEAANLNPSSAKNFDCIRQDIHAVAWLGRYYRDRITSATHLEFYEQTFHHPELTMAYEYLQKAVSDWDRLSEVTEEHYGFVPEYIRMGVKDFRWRDEGRSLGVDLDQINNLEATFRQLPQEQWYRGIIGHVPPLKARPGKPLKLTATFASEIGQGQYGSANSSMHLFYRSSHDLGYTQVDLQRDNASELTWTGEIPADKVLPGALDYYFEVNRGKWYHGYGGTLESRPAYHVLVNDNDSKPVISHTPPAGTVRGDSVTLSVTVGARAKIKSVGLYYKRMPAYYEWVRIEMQPAGEGQFSAPVPLTPEGILYYVEALDKDGNAANYPDFLQRTPYFVIDSWAP
jgi:hypothetical protein